MRRRRVTAWLRELWKGELVLRAVEESAGVSARAAACWQGAKGPLERDQGRHLAARGALERELGEVTVTSCGV